MSRYDIVLLTEDRYVQPQEVDWYVEQILTEDRLVQEALEKKGLRVTRKSWSDPKFDWSTCQYGLFRATWDYFDRFEEFRSWLENTRGKLELINPVDTIQWNMDKHYLLDLESQGINITPSLFIEKEEEGPLIDFCNRASCDEFVLKPAVSGGAKDTYRFTRNQIDEYESLFRQLVDRESMILQPFQKNVLEHGEVAYMIFGGKFTHAVLKKGKQGDFRVQDDHGGTVHNYNPSAEEIAFAEDVVRRCGHEPVYARVDVLLDNENELSVCELELIEPELWFRLHEPAAEVLANSIFQKFFTKS